MPQAFPEYTLGDLEGSHLDQIGKFEIILDQAEEKGVISHAATDTEDTYDLKTQRIRIQTIASRLYLLGYLSKKTTPKNIEKRLDVVKEAVGNFQKDANLKVDNWVGDVTWYALDELVSFESVLSKRKWFKEGRVRPQVEKAIHRGIQLRLWSLGLYKNRPNQNFKLLGNDSLKNFQTILRIFLVEKTSLNNLLSEDTISLLFDQDALTRAIASRAGPDLSNWQLNFSGKKSRQQKLARKFIINSAKIELWLLGYKVKIDGRDDFEYSLSSDLYVAISQYYQQFGGLAKTKAEVLARKITPSLFKGISEASEESDSFNVDDASAEVAKEISTATQVEKAWSYVKEKGISLWDGLKRIWRWMKKIGKKALSFIEKNVFKGFFRFVTKAYRIVKKGMSAVIRSFDVYLKGKLILPGIQLEFTKDMDTVALISKSSPTEQVLDAMEKRNRRSKAFSVGCRMISLAFGVFKKLASNVLGWARLLISLVRGYKDLKVLYFDFKALTG